ncbi:alpha/beta family hydrolase [Thaumasiovibrio subtropicus]|uniref:alpha/beta family hydrolase n=1 Tax=Thaumasiovibrio subtropicus TaxID=1891207 RepID=UPI000B3571BA|nr:alpha/beta family hydrolase [Thaumasiovibrio subtropicus]
MYLIDGPDDSPINFLFAHGAGAGMDHDFMTAVAKGLANEGIRVIRFNFPYMVKRAEDGKKRPPDRAPKLLEDFQQHIDAHSERPLVIGGKSMGGRMASLVATENPTLAGVACLGFPFHAPGKDVYRGEHLTNFSLPCLILQGERDTFGHRAEVESYSFSAQVKVQFLPDGDHSFKPRKASGKTEAENIAEAVDSLSRFIKAQLA